MTLPVDYQLGSEIGRGAIATTYQVHRLSDGQILAGKLLHASHRRDQAALARFHGEAELCARLHHLHIVTVHGMTEIDGAPVLLMELVDGPNLALLIAREAPLPLPRLLRLARGITAGLKVAHEAGIIHRDLKPANILIGPGEVPKIADFGMARASSFAGVSGSAFTVLGTPDYMAPECLDPLAVDPRTDLYALGCILYELCAGQPPYCGATAFAVLEQHQTAPIPEVPGAYPPALRQLCAALLSKSAADRPPAAAAVLETLDAIAGSAAAAPGTALAPVIPAPTGAAGSCARCDAQLLQDVPVCFGCGLLQARYEKGPCSVMVTGPGAVAEQLDSALRERLLLWAEHSPGLGLSTGQLRKAIPRLPFALATGLAARAADTLRSSVEALGFRCAVVRGGPFHLPEMRKKMWVLGGRTMAVVSAGGAGVWGQVHHNPVVFLGLMGIALAGGFTVGARRAMTGVLQPVPSAAAPLPGLLQERVQALLQVVPTLEQPRHRQALRGVVQRALGLRRALPEKDRADLDEPLAQALDQALVAAGRMDAIDRAISGLLTSGEDLNQAGPQVRQLLLERDTFAGRLLDLSALLESLRARLAAARVGGGAAERDEALSELRVRVAALEEVERL